MNINEKWLKPSEISEADAAYGFIGGEKIPNEDEIPEEFWNANIRNKWQRLQSEWFFNGLPEGAKFYPNEEVNPEKALAHLASIQRCFGISHEHKEAAVSWLASLWFKDYEFPPTTQ